MKTGEPGLRGRAVFPSEAAFRALQKSHRGRREESRPNTRVCNGARRWIIFPAEGTPSPLRMNSWGPIQLPRPRRLLPTPEAPASPPAV